MKYKTTEIIGTTISALVMITLFAMGGNGYYDNSVYQNTGHYGYGYGYGYGYNSILPDTEIPHASGYSGGDGWDYPKKNSSTDESYSSVISSGTYHISGKFVPEIIKDIDIIPEAPIKNVKTFILIVAIFTLLISISVIWYINKTSK